MTEPKFIKGDLVVAEDLGVGYIEDAYKARGVKGWLYHIKQGIYSLGNVREAWIRKIPRFKVKKKKLK